MPDRTEGDKMRSLLTTDDRRPTTDDRRPTTDDRRLTTDDRRPTTDGVKREPIKISGT
jgi:hypothetical protein